MKVLSNRPMFALNGTKEQQISENSKKLEKTTANV